MRLTRVYVQEDKDLATIWRADTKRHVAKLNRRLQTEATTPNMETKIYEGYGPGRYSSYGWTSQVDNANRTISQVRPSFTKYGGNLGTEGSV